MGSIRLTRRTSFLVFLAICLAALSAREVRADRSGSLALRGTIGEDDLACAEAPVGSVEQVPAPVDLWAVVVCARQSQALVPVEGMVWLAHGTRDPVSILALPPDAAPVPKSAEYDPQYGVRFKSFHSTEAKEKKRERLISRLKAAMGAEPIPVIGRVFQLDAVSTIYDMRYNIFFYLESRRPRFALACIDQCRKALLMDVLTADEARARLAGR